VLVSQREQATASLIAKEVSVSWFRGEIAADRDSILKLEMDYVDHLPRKYTLVLMVMFRRNPLDSSRAGPNLESGSCKNGPAT